ncbi:MAG: tetratricopeptide repeat protein [Candidatus Obscuribacterales bacterium]|nr:tetratricopeptide repeat protein [Candidatus Obscuribacterales bacterium]
MTRHTLGENNAKTVNCKYITAECLRCASNLEESAALYEEALEFQLAEYGKDSPQVAWTLDNLGRVYQSLNKTSRAESLYKDAIRAWQSSGQSLLVARCQNRLALLQALVLDQDRKTTKFAPGSPEFAALFADVISF